MSLFKIDVRESERVGVSDEVALGFHKIHIVPMVIVQETGEIFCVPMPDKCRREMLADWRGVGKSLGKPEVVIWYTSMRHRIQLHPDTRAWVESQIKQF